MMEEFRLPDFEAIERRNNEWREEAKQTLLPGIDPSDFKKGMRVTISPNLRHGDRSYTDEIHEIVAFNTGHVQTRIPDRWSGDKGDRLIMLLISEHHFYSAEDFAA